MNPVLEEMFASGTIGTGNGRVHRLRDAISPNEARLLEALCRFEGATTTLEIGLACGGSTLAILEGKDHQDGIHYAIDPFQSSQWDMCGAENVRRAGFKDQFVLLEEYDDQVLPRLVRDGLRIDFAFIDGDHRLEHTWMNWYYVDKLLMEGGLVAFHDYPWIEVYCAVLAALATGRYQRLPQWELRRPWAHRLARLAINLVRARNLTEGFLAASAGVGASTHMAVLRKVG